MPYKALSMWYFVYYIPIKTFHILPAFYFKSFQHPKMPKYVATHRKMTQKTKKLIKNCNECKDTK